MAEQEIVCPHCEKKIALTEALIHPIEDKLRMAYEEKEKKINEKIKEMQKVLEQKEKSLEEAKRKY